MVNAFQNTIDYTCSNNEDSEEDIMLEGTKGSYDSSDESNSDDNDIDEHDKMNDVQKDFEEFDDREQDHDQAFAFEDLQRLSCFSHTLQLIVAKFDTVKPCREAVSLSKKMVARFNKLVKGTEKLVNLSGKKLIGYCPTRWSSTYLLLKRLIDLRPHVESVLGEMEWDGLQVRHWKAIENLVMLLEPFADYTSLSGGEDYTTISCVVPILMELELHLEKVNYTSKLCMQLPHEKTM